MKYHCFSGRKAEQSPATPAIQSCLIEIASWVINLFCIGKESVGLFLDANEIFDVIDSLSYSIKYLVDTLKANSQRQQIKALN